MLYELIGVVRITRQTATPTADLISQVRPGRGINEIKEYHPPTPPPSRPYPPNPRLTRYLSRIARTTGSLILTRGGVIRGLTNWGTFHLPKPARKQGALYHQGHYFILRFDSDGRTQHAVRRTLGLDPRMIRYSVVKMGDKLEEIAGVDGRAEWESGRTGEL